MAVVAFAALNGFRRGLVGRRALAGRTGHRGLFRRAARAELLGETDTAYTPLVALGGRSSSRSSSRRSDRSSAAMPRGGLVAVPPLRVLDSAGGFVLGAATGLALVWVLGAVALHLPGQTELRREVQASTILRHLNREFPPQRLMDAIARVDPFSAVVGPEADVRRRTRASSAIPRSACARHGAARDRYGLRPRRPGLGLDRAAGSRGHERTRRRGGPRPAGRPPRRRGASGPRRVLRCHERRRGPARGRPRRAAAGARGSASGAAVVVLGYPLNGPLTATPGRIGGTATVLTEDAYGRGPISRSVTSSARSFATATPAGRSSTAPAACDGRFRVAARSGRRLRRAVRARAPGARIAQGTAPSPRAPASGSRRCSRRSSAASGCLNGGIT